LYLLVEFEVPHEVSFGGIPVATWSESYVWKITQPTDLECMNSLGIKKWDIIYYYSRY
jgi:hypothetical protein